LNEIRSAIDCWEQQLIEKVREQREHKLKALKLHQEQLESLASCAQSLIRSHEQIASIVPVGGLDAAITDQIPRMVQIRQTMHYLIPQCRKLSLVSPSSLVPGHSTTVGLPDHFNFTDECTDILERIKASAKLLSDCQSTNNEREEDDIEAFFSNSYDDFFRATILNDAEAQFELGVCHKQGSHGMEENAVAAVTYFRQSMEQGHPAATFELAQCYWDGLGVPKEVGEAVGLLRQAADLGHVRAMLQLGAYYQRSAAGMDDLSEAAWYYSLASQHGRNLLAVHSLQNFTNPS
jgi:hypothetical protein